MWSTISASIRRRRKSSRVDAFGIVGSLCAGWLMRRGDGSLWLWSGNADGGLDPDPVRIGTGWGAVNLLVSVGDLSGDGHTDFLSRNTPVLAEIARRIAVIDRFQDFTRGVVSLRDLIFFATFIGFWLFLNAVIVEQRKAD